MAKIISIEGNIGSGKSTFVKFLRDYFKDNHNILFLEEPVHVWNTIKDISGVTMIEKFYENQKRYAFSFQMMAYISRISILRNAIKTNPNKIIITERCVETDRNVFAKMLYDNGLIENVEFQIYLKWFDEFIQDIQINAFIYINACSEVCYSRILKRNRKGENIPLDYLKKCEHYHNLWLENNKKNGTTKHIWFNASENKKNIHDYKEWLCIIENLINSMSLHEIKNEFNNIKMHTIHSC